MGAQTVVFFLSTGRCGTQWLAESLHGRYPDIEVEHEPIGPLYRPRAYFRHPDPTAMLAEPAVQQHVERLSRSTYYVETGWPSFAALPLLARLLGERLRVVHLTRHPVPTALSHLAHSSYAGSPRDDEYTRMATLGPSDPNVVDRKYADTWQGLSPYRKCLFWWTEVSRFGVEFPERFVAVPFLRIKSEDLLGGDPATLERLLGFMELPWADAWLAQTDRLVDRWHHRTDRDVDPLEVVDHPEAVEVAARLGYDVLDVDRAELDARYRGEPDPGLDRVGRFA